MAGDNRLLPQGERLRIAKETDIGLFGASWWPYASFEALRIATYLSIWVGVLPGNFHPL